MNEIDIAILLGITIFVYRGARHGMAQELLGITGWVLALLIAMRMAARVAGWIVHRVPELPGQIAMIISFLLLLFASRIFFQIFIQFFQHLFSKEMHTKVNRLVGALLGFIKGAFFISVLVLVLQTLPVSTRIESLRKSSALSGHMSKFARLLVDVAIRFAPQIEEPLQQGAKRINELKEVPNDSQPDL
ncbi:MAG TPA: CvpA family protein [bacterium]|jgi:membrane protein required for colicin V production|nr:CvpA family protein [bacterium]HNT66660.1 CvpA family protein [bacterium]